MSPGRIHPRREFCLQAADLLRARIRDGVVVRSTAFACSCSENDLLLRERRRGQRGSLTLDQRENGRGRHEQDEQRSRTPQQTSRADPLPIGDAARLQECVDVGKCGVVDIVPRPRTRLVAFAGPLLDSHEVETAQQLPCAGFPVSRAFGHLEQCLGRMLFLRQPLVAELPPESNQALVRDVDVGVWMNVPVARAQERRVAVPEVIDDATDLLLDVRA